MKRSSAGRGLQFAPAQQARLPRVRRSFAVIGAILGAATMMVSGARAQQLVTINETFTGTTMGSDWLVGGSNYTPGLTAPGVDTDGNGWLRLTSAGNQQATYARSTTSFAGADATIAVKFNYAAYGGTLGSADGITFFLADASKTFAVGAYGGSLGYAQQTLAGGGGGNINGLNGGYIGLGIDEYGNYSNPTEGRVGGPGFLKPNVSIRGPGQGLTGYDYLGGTGQLTTPIAFAGSRPTGDNERVFQVVITATNQLTVYMQAGATAPMESLYSIDLSGYERPENLVMGFTGSTGGENNIHEIQGLKLASQAATIWDRGGGNNSWSTATNWKGDQAPTTGADILLSNQFVSTAQTVDVGVGATQSIRSLQIDAPFSYTLNNGTLQFNDQGILGPSGIIVSQSQGSAVHTVNSAIIADHALEIRNSSTAALNLTGTVDNGGSKITLAGSGTTSLSGVISGAGSINKTDAGTAILSGNSTYAGGTTLTSGTLTVGHNNALGTGDLTIKSGTLGSNASNTILNDISLQGNATLSNITTGGTLTQTANRTLTMSGATQSGLVNLSDSNTARTLTVQVDSGSSTISGVIQNGGTGAGNVNKSGNGTLVLSGANAYTGTTRIDAGTLQLGNSNVLADTSALNIAGGTFNLSGNSDRIGVLSFSNGGMIDFGSTSGTNTFVFNTIGTASGVLTIKNWQQSNSDFLGSITGGVAQATLDSFYFSGIGAGATQSGVTTSTIFGNAYQITPVTTTGTAWTSNSNANWSVNGNWASGVGPNPNSTTAVANFGFANTANGTQRGVTLDTGRTVNGVRFDPNANGSYTISGANTLTMSGPNANSVAFVQQQSSFNQTLGGATTTLALARNTVFDVTGTGNLTVAAAITGSTSLVKEGTGGTLILTNNNTGFTGNVFVTAGTLQISNAGALGTTGAAMTTVYEDATLALSGGIAVGETISLTGGGAGNSGALRNISGTNSVSTALALAGATRINSDGGTLTLSGGITGTNLNLTFGGSGTGAITESGVIALGTGGVTVNHSGSGTVTFSGGASNTYTGITSVDAGTLVLGKTIGFTAVAGNLVIGNGVSGLGEAATVQLNVANQINNASSVTINSDGTFNLNGNVETIASLSGSGGINNSAGTATTLTINGTDTTTFSGVIQDTGANLTLAKQGTGKLTLSGANSYAGGTTLTAGIIAIQNNTALGTAAATIASGGNLEVSGGLTNVANTININGTGTNAGDGAIQSTSGANTLTGAITLQSNSRIQSDSGSTLTIQGLVSGTNRSLTLGGEGNITVTGNIQTGTGTLTKDGGGYVILNPTANNSTFTGATLVNAGTLEIQRTTALGNTAGGATVANGATLAISGSITTAETPLTLNGAGANTTGALRNVSGTNTVSGAVALPTNASIGSDAGTLTVSGVISGVGTMTKVGAGTVTLSGGGANTLSGGVTVNDSTLILNKTAGTNAVGSGAVTIGDGTGAANSAVLQTSAATQLTNANNVTVNSDGRFNVNSTAQTIGALAGTGNITLGTGNTLTVGNATSSTFTGSLSTTGTGQLTKTGTGTLTIAGTDGSNAFAANRFNLNQGTLQLGANDVLAGGIYFSGGTFSVNGFNETVSSATLTANSVLDFNSLAGIFDVTNGTYTGGTLTINNWAGSFSGGGASQLLLPGTITGGLLANITFSGYSPGAKLIGNEIVPLTGTVHEWNIGGSGNWVTDANWTPDPAGTGIGPNASNIAVVFGTAATANATVTVTGTKAVGYMTFEDDNKYTIAGGTVNMNVGGGSAQINLTNSGGGEISSAMTLSDNLQIAQNSTGLLTLSGATISNASGTRNITVGGAGDTLISSSIATAGGTLTKNNGGTLTLSGANTFTGGTTVNAGVLAISANNNLGGAAGTLTLNGGTLQNTAVVTANRTFTINANGGTLQTDATLTNTGAINGAGTLNKTGTGTFITGGALANGHTGNINVLAGTYQIGKTAAVSAIGDAAAVTVDGTLNFNGTGAYVAETIGSLAGGGTVNNASANALALTTGGNNASTTFSGIVQDTGTGALALTKTGTGTMTLTGTNSYAGLTTVSNGVLNIQNGAALGATTSGTTVAAGAALELQHGTGITVGDAITINTTTNGALRNISGNNTITATTTLGAAATIRSDAGTLTLQNLVTGTNRALTLDGAGGITITGNITTGTGTLTKNGTGYAILSGTNTYTGTSTINAGTLEIRSAAALGGTGAGTTVVSGATLALGGTGTSFSAEPLTLNGSGQNSNGALRNVAGTNTYTGTIALASGSVIGTDTGTTLTASGIISGTNSLTKIGDGTLILSGVNTYTGGTTISAGRVQIAADTGLGAAPGAVAAGNVTLNNATLATSATMTLNTNRGLALGGSGGTIETMGGTLTYAGIIAGNSGGPLTKTGTGTLFLNGVNTFTGNVNVNGGTLQIAANNRLGNAANDLSFDGGTLATTATMTLSGRDVALNAGGGTMNVASASVLTVDGVVSGTGALTKSNAGSLVFTGDNTYSGGTTISGGTLQIGNGGTTGSVGTGAIANNASLSVNRSDTYTIGGAMSGIGSFIQAGTGTTVFTGNNNYSGTTTINAGTLQIGSGGTSGTLGPGAVTNNAALVFNRSDAMTAANTISGSGSVTQSGGGTTTVSGNNSYTGATTISAGTLRLGHTSALGTTAAGTTVGTGGALDLNGFTLGTAEALTLNGTGVGSTGALTNSSGTAVNYSGAVTLATNAAVGGSGNIAINGAIGGSGGLIKVGANTVTLANANTYTGATSINGGTLQIQNASALGTTAGGTTIASGATLALAGDIAVGAESISLQGSGFGGAGAIANVSGNNSLAGPLTLVAASQINVSSGSLTLSGNINAAGFDFTLDTVGNAFLTGAVAMGGGTLIKTGGGDLTFDSDFSFAGNLTLAGGTVNLAGADISVGTLRITGNTILDFGNSTNSSLNVSSIYIASGATVTIRNWAEWDDVFTTLGWQNNVGQPVSVPYENPTVPPVTQIDFDGWAPDSTRWREYGGEITPTPEPSTYGALLLSLLTGLVYWRRRKHSRSAK